MPASFPVRLRRAAVARADRLAVRRFTDLAAREDRPPGVDRATVRAFRRLASATAAGGARHRGVDRALARSLRLLADADIAGTRPSPVLRRAIRDGFHRRYYHAAKSTWQDTRFLGVRVWKTPLDLWIYQELLHEVRPDVLVEAGTKFGGSAWYFAHLFDLIGHGEVVTIDVTAQKHLPEHPRITYLSGSSSDPAVAAQVDEIVGDGKVLVVLDSDHSRDHVLDELRLWSPRVPVGSYVVVEDTHADGHPVTTRFGAGPWDAVTAFMAEDDGFRIDRKRHKFLMSFNRRGYLERVRESSPQPPAQA